MSFEGFEFWVSCAVLGFAAYAFVGDASGEGFGEVVFVYEFAIGGYFVGFEFYAVVAEGGVDFVGVESGTFPCYGAVVGEPFAGFGVDCAAGVDDVDAVALAEASQCCLVDFEVEVAVDFLEVYFGGVWHGPPGGVGEEYYAVLRVGCGLVEEFLERGEFFGFGVEYVFPGVEVFAFDALGVGEGLEGVEGGYVVGEGFAFFVSYDVAYLDEELEFVWGCGVDVVGYLLYGGQCTFLVGGL